MRAHLLPHNHILLSLMESRSCNHQNSHNLFLDSLSCHQREITKGSIIDMDNRFNKVFPLFDPLNKEFSPSSYIIDIFFSWFSFHYYNKYSNDTLIVCSRQLDNIAITTLLDHLCALVVTDTSIKNNVATSITYIHVCDKPIIKTLYYAGNITFTKAKLFAITCSINQVINIQEISKIIVDTDSIYATKRIFNPSLHLYQIYSASISNKLRKFFLLSSSNLIEFWKCPSWCSWLLHKVVDRETKKFHHSPLFPCKLF